ncbi:helix-turn-helix domain-containing protein [Nonomuraea endophytica]|uniref:helix-turn-helix domain-containing protein n=1 Tax=Nonomuraea endophytica TaxID=714136 RepID=UPI0037C63EE5
MNGVGRGRRERPVPAGPLRDFAEGLRALRAAAGRPSYRALETRAGYSASALSAAAAGERLPSLPVTLAYVGACGGDMVAWEHRWHLACATCQPPADAANWPATRTSRLRRRRAGVAVALFLAGLVAVRVLTHEPPSRPAPAVPQTSRRQDPQDP